MNLTTESAQLEKAFLDRHRHSVAKEPMDGSGDGGGRIKKWVARGHFSVEVGEQQIKEYIQTWNLQPRWLYSLDFLCSTEVEHHTFYHYRARFSTPTPQRPIQGTASVYFAVDVSKVKPQTLPVEVLFAVESNRLVHSPGRTKFTDKWLTDVIQSKILLRRAANL